VAIPIAMWALVIAVALPLSAPLPGLYFAVGSSMLGIPLAIWRVRLIRNIFAEGVEVPSRISRSLISPKTGRVKYEYTYQGKDYKAANNLSIFTLAYWRLEAGKEVVVVVHRRKSQRALVRQLYV
jgi:hypothetical protein